MRGSVIRIAVAVSLLILSRPELSAQRIEGVVHRRGPRLDVIESGTDLPPVDLVLVTVKSQHTLTEW